MKFEGSQKTPPHQDRRLQLRMLGFVGLIGVVMFAAQAWRIGNGKGGSSHPHYPLAMEEPDEAGGGQRPPVLKEDEIRILPHESPDATDDLDVAADDTRGLDISPSWLANVQDNTLGIRKQEADAYYRILAKVRSVSPRKLQTDAVPDVLYVNLLSSPETYRGRPITVTGEVINLYEYQAGENPYDITRLYDAWILTPDSGNQPYRVVCQSIPPELQPGKNLHQSVRVTGYFFKKEAYESQGRTVHVAPTLLAGRLSLHASPYVAPPVEEVVPWMVGVVTVIGLAMLATVIGFALSDSRQRRWRLSAEVNEVDAAAFSRADHRLSISESLRRLENDEPLENEAHIREHTNGHRSTADLPDEIIDLPTPFPPTRVPKRWDEPQ